MFQSSVYIEEEIMTDDQRDTRERLLEAASDLFAMNGYAGTSIRDIASKADVNVAAVNYYFQGKENLYHEVLRHVFGGKRERYMAAMSRVLADHPGDMEAILQTFYRTHFEDTLKTPHGRHFLRLFIREFHHGQPRNTQLISELLLPLWTDLGENLLASCPEVTGDISPWIAGSLHGQMVHFTMRWHKPECGRDTPNPIAQIFPGLTDDVDAYIDQAVDHITRFSMAGIRACIEAQHDEGDTP